MGIEVRELEPEEFYKLSSHQASKIGLHFGSGYWDDAVSAGVVGALEYMTRYDPAKGAKPSTWASRGAYRGIVDWVRSYSGRRRGGREDLTERARLRTYWNLTEGRSYGWENGQNDEIRTSGKSYLGNWTQKIEIELPTQEEDLDRLSLRQAVNDLLGTMDERSLKILFLYHTEDMSVAEIARRIDLSESRVAVLLNRAERIARAKLDSLKMWV